MIIQFLCLNHLFERCLIMKDEAIKRLMPQKLKDQYVFKTEEAVSILEVD